MLAQSSQSRGSLKLRGYIKSHGYLKSRGAVITELIVVLPALLLLGLGVLQSALFYQAKTTVTYATFEAARKGAVNHGQTAPMLDEFGIRISPLFGGDGSSEKALAAIGEGRIEAGNSSYTRLDIINPSSEAFTDFAVINRHGRPEIPNSHLKYRDPDAIGPHSGVNIHDANLLKIHIQYGYELKVPLVRELITTVLKVTDAGNAALYNAGRIPVAATATVRMQSTAWENGNLSRSQPPANFVASNPAITPLPGANSLTGGGSNPNSNTGSADDETSDEDDIQCESYWSDARYQAQSCDRWFCKISEWSSDVKAAANVLWDFAEGFVAGVSQQLSDLWSLLEDPSVLLDLAKAFIDDPKGTIEAIVDGVVEDAEKLAECGPKDVGHLIGETLSPAAPVAVLNRLAKISGNQKLLHYAQKKEREIECASFPAGVFVWASGGQTPIEQLRNDAMVMSRHELSFETEAQPVTQTFSRTANELRKIHTEHGSLLLTPEHPVWVQGKGWVPAEDVEWEDPLATMHGDTVAYENQIVAGTVDVFNISVGNTPNYFAGEMGLWVHNANCKGSVLTVRGKLRKALDEAGNYDSTWQAHHIIPTAVAPNSVALRAAADRGLYYQDGALNGLMLPNKVGATPPGGNVVRESVLPLHKSSHTSRDNSGPVGEDIGYQDYVRQKLQRLDQRYQREDWSDERLVSEIARLQEAVVEDLMAGRVLLCGKCGPTNW